LAECNKRQNLRRDLPTQIRRLQRAGLQVQGGFIVGFDHDTPDIFGRQFDLIQDNGVVMAMVGLLQAPIGTELYKRLEREGRNNVVDDTNVITRMDRDTLRRRYRQLVRTLYEPDTYYRRVRNFLAEYKEPKEQPPPTLAALLAVGRCLFWLGCIRRGRGPFWRTLLWTVFRKRESVQNFLGLAIVGYHFRKLCDDLLREPHTGRSSSAARREEATGRPATVQTGA
jgi:hypothetical protein